MKQCSSCRMPKADTEFYKDASRRDRLTYACKECLRNRVAGYQQSNPERVKESQRKFIRSQKGKASARRNHLHKYGMTESDLLELFAAQGHRCAICNGTDGGRFWCVDHDHETGIVRGVLCWHCNVGLGHFRDNPAALASAIVYLTRRRVADGRAEAS